MNAGKSFLTRQIVLNLHSICFSKSVFKTFQIIFISKSEESKDELEKICLLKKYHFTWWKIIHSLEKLLNQSNTNKQTIVIFEDMTPFINSADNKSNSDMIDFLYRSRHSNISILIIMHGIRHSLSKRTSFERIFLDNCSGLFIFKPISNKRVIYSYLKNILDKNTCDKLDQLFEFVSKLTNYPYLLIQANKSVEDDISKIRSDIFGKNLFFQSGI